MEAACRNCTDRKVGCHDDCPRYKEFRIRVEEIRENERRIKQNEIFGRKLRK